MLGLVLHFKPAYANHSACTTASLRGYQPLQTKALYAAAELGVADALAGGPLPVEQLAAPRGVKPDALCRVLRLLASMGIFKEVRPGRRTGMRRLMAGWGEATWMALHSCDLHCKPPRPAPALYQSTLHHPSTCLLAPLEPVLQACLQTTGCRGCCAATTPPPWLTW